MNRTKLLILCIDNRHRSPLTWAIMRQYHRLDCISAGFDPEAISESPPKQLIDAAKEMGIELKNFRASPVNVELLKWANYFVVHDHNDITCLIHCAKRWNFALNTDQIVRLGTFANPPVLNILDPDDLYLKPDEYNDEIDAITLASHKLASHLSNGQIPAS